MNPVVTFLSFYLLRLGLATEKNDESILVGFSRLKNEVSNQDWEDIFNHGVQQSIAAILFDGLQRLVDAQLDLAFQLPERNLKMKWFAHAMQVEKRYKRQEQVIASLAKFYSEHDIKMMILKGYGLSLLYPIPSRRPSGDIDIWQFGEEERSDRLICEKLGIRIDTSHHHHTVFIFNGVTVENHYDFVNQYSSLSNRDFEKEMHGLVKAQTAETVKVNGHQVFLPPATFNAVFLMRHMGQHFASTEIALRHIVDWAMFVKHYHQEVDWQRMEQFAKKQKMWRFLSSINGLCVDYLGLPDDIFPTWGRDMKLEEKIMNDILQPVFAEQSTAKMGTFQDKVFRFRRWWGNRWKRKLVFRENLLVAFLVLLRSHLVKPQAYQ